MPKRKASTPQQISAKKRQELSWKVQICSNPSRSSDNDQESIIDDCVEQIIEVEYISESHTPNLNSFQVTNKYAHSSFKEIEFRQLLDDCCFFIQVHPCNAEENSSSGWTCHLCSFSAILNDWRWNDPLLPEAPEYWLYINYENSSRCMLYCEKAHLPNNNIKQNCESDSFWFHIVKITSIPANVLQTVKLQKHMFLTLIKFDSMNGVIEIGVFLRESGISKFSYPCEVNSRINSLANVAKQHMFNYLLQIDCQGMVFSVCTLYVDKFLVTVIDIRVVPMNFNK